MSENESDAGLDDMQLPWPARIFKPFSVVVLWILNWFESGKDYFEEVRIENNEEHEDEKVEMYFHAAFLDRSRWHLLLVSPVGLVYLLDTCSVLAVSPRLQLYGLALDLIGAFILAVGLFRGTDAIKRDTEMAEALWGSQYYTSSMSSIARDTVDGIYGATFLVAGFTIQFIAVATFV